MTDKPRVRYDIKESQTDNLVKKQKAKGARKLTLREMNLAKTKNTITGNRTVICADISGSMGGAKLRGLQKALTDIWSAGIVGIAFNSNVYDIEQSDIPHLTATGSTAMYEALMCIWTDFPDIKHIILISDGEPDEPPGEGGIIAETRMNHRDVVIDTIGIADRGAYGYNPDFLRELAEITGGKFTDCGNPIALSSIVETLLLDYQKQRIKGPQSSGAIQL